MDNRVALMAIIVEDRDSVKELNDLLHEYGDYIIGRMGIPYHKIYHCIRQNLKTPNMTEMLRLTKVSL